MRLITNIIIIISFLLSGYYLYLHIIPLDINKLLLGILSIILLIVPIIIGKLNNKKIEKYIKLIYYFFLLIAFILGGLFGLYYSTSFFDLLVHGLFGFLLTLILSTKFDLNNKYNMLLLISVVITIGFLWESLEFFSDIFLKTDHQEKISGATDTMTDLLISIVGIFIYIIYFKVMNKIKK